MSREYLILAARIEAELLELEPLVERVKTAWLKAEKTGDDLYLDSVALNLHGFYAGVEKIFELIAVNIDQIKSTGEAWHQDLLKQMSMEIKRVRPPVISQQTGSSLDEYRGFRHVVRNIYAFNLSAAKMKPLVNNLQDVFKQTKLEIQKFNYLLENINTGK